MQVAEKAKDSLKDKVVSIKNVGRKSEKDREVWF